MLISFVREPNLLNVIKTNLEKIRFCCAPNISDYFRAHLKPKKLEFVKNGP